MGQNDEYPKLDYTIVSEEQRKKIVNEIIQKTPKEKLTPRYLEILAEYLLETPEAKKEKRILTKNRLSYIARREISFEELASKLENGQNGIYNFMTGGDKDILFIQKISITEKDEEQIPGLKQLRDEIKKVQERQKVAHGKKKYLLTKQMIEMRRDQYVLKMLFRQPISFSHTEGSFHDFNVSGQAYLNEKGEPESTESVSFFDPTHIACLLKYYSSLKQSAEGRFQGDLYYIMESLDDLIKKVLVKDYPIFYDILLMKIDGDSNKQISNKIKQKYDVNYSNEFISNVWCQKIPKILALEAKKDWLVWYYTMKEKGKWKRCSRCHQIKLAHPYFFSKNNTAKDGWYSMCKECRNKKKG